ncbi:MAG TPA: V-type ATP synthase subunit D [Rectinema sp.]|jgi:V/A-type H+-transporting ATPase subunit D|nr:V-type ATP synthase subunit D [Spirochaetia bacterium]MDI9426498.1 V-type ATP synthase subunit D [Spirochaetota bacterium]NLH90175.1 V-type ATP synthase subunit D [Treponema sp.]OQC74390.1 MAG: V-type ATP synthase subunit D [Spirochaetes bacterium ADurb.Bin001]HNP92592.1 V-type ATP synthase subunit D [Rectinema sp.]
MGKIKLTKNELKKKRDELKMYERYLPTLQLKKQQLQVEVRSVQTRMEELQALKKTLEQDASPWMEVFAEQGAARTQEGEPLLKVAFISTDTGNIAGVAIPLFLGVEFEHKGYDLYSTSLWVDAALILMERLVRTQLELEVVSKQKDLLSQELRITTQRVNLFEKVKIPETIADIRKIRIYLGDQETAQVVRGKIAKRKVEGAER